MGSPTAVGLQGASPDLAGLTVPAPPPGPADWNDDGVVLLPGAIPDDFIEEYEAEWIAANGEGTGITIDHGVLRAREPRGWRDCTPYMRHDALRRLVTHPGIAAAVEGLIGEPGGVHLNLTGWVTTERDWHQDSYLNEPEVGDFYAAVWIALGNVHENAGPFQYVPGSHRWPQVTRRLIGRHVDLKDPMWPEKSEAVLSPLFAQEIAERKAEPATWLPRKGDLLIWHGRLLHRGSRARLPGAYRPALIAHYSGIHHRPAMPRAVQEPSTGGWYFPIAERHPVR